jgi:hypothetical protein
MVKLGVDVVMRTLQAELASGHRIPHPILWRDSLVRSFPSNPNNIPCSNRLGQRCVELAHGLTSQLRGRRLARSRKTLAICHISIIESLENRGTQEGRGGGGNGRAMKVVQGGWGSSLLPGHKTKTRTGPTDDKGIKE